VRHIGREHTENFISLFLLDRIWEKTMRKVVVVLLFAFAIWALCGMTMGISMEITSLQNALIIHAIAAPIIAAAISFVYFNRFSYTAPLQTAIIFVAFVILLDLFVVALVVNKSLGMFESFLGTWIPLVLIFVATCLTGAYARKRA
jgi:hypothetical protein